MLFLTLALAATLPLARADNASTPRDPMRPIGAAEAAGRRGGMLFSIEPAAGATPATWTSVPWMFRPRSSSTGSRWFPART
ncbi:MAG: hypothetical protein IPM70_04340 [Proteobacteria bacterium]|nr:hypothetical protein [Pseudomonadota bacterium]